MIRGAFGIIALAVIFTFTVLVVVNKVEADRSVKNEYCEVRVQLAMHIFDSVKSGLSLDRINAAWGTPPINEAHSKSRNAWWEKLKLEVDTLMKEGRLSLHIQKIIAERCKDIPVEQCCLIMTYYKKDGRIILDAVDT
tara:strand:- start:396 stop:809 length:414 start_codon:yes stop_codon:yes gene_type:complete